MSTNKPRIQAYVQSSLYTQFEEERASWGLSQSQALERMLEDRYAQDGDFETEASYKEIEELKSRLTAVEQENNFQECRWKLTQENSFGLVDLIQEIKADLLKRVEILELKLKLVTNDSLSELDSEPQLVTDELGSETELVTNDSLSELDSEPQLVTNDSLSELDSEPQLVTDELGSETELVTNDSLSELDSEPQLVTDELPSELSKFIICEIDKEVQSIKYWAGSKAGFVRSLVHAKRYKSPNMMQRPMRGILADSSYNYFKKQPERFKLKSNSLDFFLKNPHYNPNAKYEMW